MTDPGLLYWEILNFEKDFGHLYRLTDLTQKQAQVAELADALA